MSTVTQAKMAIKAGRAAGVGVWLWGTHGIGKSEIVAQVAKDEGIELIDIRAALTEAGDWMGLPVAEENNEGHKTVKFHISSFLPQDPNWKGIIFLDELNRARLDVVNCVFQLVLNGCIMNHYTLPKGASIVAAGNPADDDYQVTDVDPALMGRFCHVSLTPGQDAWIDWAREDGEVRADITKFIASNKKLLESRNSSFDMKLIEPSRRGWTLLSKMVDVMEKQDTIDEALITVATGLIGTAGGVQYAEFRRTKFAVIDINKVLKDYDEVRDTVLRFKKEGRIPAQKQAVENLFEVIAKNEKAIVKDDKVYDNIFRFLNDINEDLAYFAASLLMDSGLDSLTNKFMDAIDNGHKPSIKFRKIITNLDRVERSATNDV